MIPVRELLNRIRWDEEFGKGEFEIGYFDHIARQIIRIPLGEVRFEEGNHFSFQIQGIEGEVLTIPLHRIKEIYRNGCLIWQRQYGTLPG